MTSATQQKLLETEQALRSVIRGKDSAIELLLTAMLAGGHILLDDVPGVGKTTLARALAQAVDAKFKRIQFTPDLLPADILGGSVFNPKRAEFDFFPGPLFSNIVLADEINRASPRTQSALLEAMNEKQISIEGRSTALPDPFLVIATENPVEYYGTYPLPEAQLDRFTMRLELGYPSEEAELEMLEARESGSNPLDSLPRVIGCAELAQAKAEAAAIRVEDSVKHYVLALIRETRRDRRLRLGASPRSFIAFIRSLKAFAWKRGRDYVTPDDVKILAVPLLAHRLIPNPENGHESLDTAALVGELLDRMPVPF